MSRAVPERFDGDRGGERPAFVTRATRWLPSGQGLPDDVWQRRHHGIVVLLWAHSLALTVFALARGADVAHAMFEGGIIAVVAAIAAQSRGGMRFRTATATLGLITSSAVLVHLSGGVIEAHFHFFAMIGIITLYQHWVPFGLAIVFVAAHHGIASTVDADSVYNHDAALDNPWKWALIHGAFVLGASAANVYAWRLNEDAAGRAEAYRLRVEEAERRRRSALEINDNVVQGLAVVTSALAMGEAAMARDAADRTITAARAIMTDLLEDAAGDGGDVVPGALRRRTSAAAGKW